VENISTFYHPGNIKIERNLKITYDFRYIVCFSGNFNAHLSKTTAKKQSGEISQRKQGKSFSELAAHHPGA